MVAFLGGEVAAVIARRSETKADLASIVRGCARFEQGIPRLLAVVESKEGKTLEWARVQHAAQPLLPKPKPGP